MSESCLIPSLQIIHSREVIIHFLQDFLFKDSLSLLFGLNIDLNLK